MNINIIDGKIAVADDAYGVTRSFTAHVCRPNAEVICGIVGINRFDVSLKANDISEIQFEVSRFYTNGAILGFDENPAYKYLISFNTILIPELGIHGLFRINEEPEVEAENTHKETKKFTAYSYESILQYENLEGFVVNYGTTTSLEMYDENLDAFGAPIGKIQLYNQDNPKLSLLNLLLTNDYYGWTIGEVDPAVASLMRSFDVSKQNIYSFLREDVSKAFECIFEFNTVSKQINVYAIRNYGNSTNILLSFERFLQVVNIKPQTDDIYTVFNVAGGNGLNISSVNYGSNKIVNADYATTLLDKDVYIAYVRWRDYREGMRNQYSEYYRQYVQCLAKQNALLNREPDSACANVWASEYTYSLEDLNTYLSNYQTVVNQITELYTNELGELDTKALDESGDAPKYYSYRDVCIPDIQNEIEARNSNDDTVAETVDYETIWPLYGITSLEAKLKAYNEAASLLKKAGYNEQWTSGRSTSQATWDAHFQEYQTYIGYINTLKALIQSRKTRVDELKSEASAVMQKMQDLAQSVSLASYFADDPKGDYYVSSIMSVFKESDYSDSNYVISEHDDSLSVIAEAEQLYQAAKDRLVIESHPQLSWAVTTDNLLAIEDFKALRDEIQLGNYIYILYGSEYVKNGVSVQTENGESIQTEDGGYLFTESSVFNDGYIRYTGDYQKLRVIEIGFSGIDLGEPLSLSFSDNIYSSSGVNDFETLLGTYVSSKTSSISAAAVSAASSAATEAATSVIRPYIEASNMKIANAEIANAQVEDLTAMTAKVQSLLANYVQADELKARVAEIDNLTAEDILVRNLVASVLNVDDLTARVANITDLTADTAFIQNLLAEMITVNNLRAVVAEIDDMIARQATIFDLQAGNITADKSIVLVNREGYGSITLNNSTMTFVDGDGSTRMVIGQATSGGEYSVDIYSAADEQGNQNLLWSSDGIESDAIGDGIIVNRMLSDGSVTNAKISNISADKVTVGTLSSHDGSSYWNLDTGEVSINGYVINARVEYALSNSPTTAPTTGWSTTAPPYEDGKYMWQRTTLSRTGSPDEVTTTCIQGATGADGEDAILLRIDSSRGTVFKNNTVNTVLTVIIYYGERRITNATELANAFGVGAYLQWEWLRINDSSYGTISASDSRLSNGGFTFTLTPDDVDTKVTFRCNLIY